MKYKNFIVRRIDGSFSLARGVVMEEDSTLALVRVYSGTEDKPSGEYSIIDIESGLSVIGTNKSRKKVLDRFHERWNEEFRQAIDKARNTRVYVQRCTERYDERKVWIESGYEV